MDKEEEIFKYSNPFEVKAKADKYFGQDIPLYLSNRKNKKYMVQNPDNKWIHFGQMGFQDYTKHKDKIRRKNYRLRASNIKGNWITDPYSPNNLSLFLLW